MDNIILSKGAHQSHEQGVCVMEAVAWFAGESHSDAPHCACPVIANFARRLNDNLDDEQRQRLTPLIPALALSRAEQPIMLKRAFIAADYAVRVFAPIELDARGLKEQATALRGLAPIVDRETAKKGSAAASATYVASASTATAAAADAVNVASYVASVLASLGYSKTEISAVASAASAASYVAYAAASYAAHATRPQRLADLGIECLEKMLAATN